VAYKLAAALLEHAGMDPALADDDLDLVALATVADVVPLQGENRRLVRAGLRALSVTRKPGLRALMEAAKVDPGALDAGAIAFRMAPRINAAGRLHRADAPLELLLTPDADRAREVAAELDACNSERRDVETRIRFEAEALVAEAPGAPAYVLAADDWHPGVVGIVAARIAERHHRPAVLIALDGDEGTGSGRSISSFDLLAGLRAGAGHLTRFGGHRAAAGLTIARGEVGAFREAFVAHAASVLSPEDLVPVERVDAVAPGDALGLSLAEELERLEPFGAGNPPVNLLVPAAVLDDPRPVGEGRHVAFSLFAGGARSRAIAFGAGSRLPAQQGAPVDAAVRLEANRWNGTVEPRLVLRTALTPLPRPIDVLGESLCDRVARELACDLTQWPPAPPAARATRRELLDSRGGGIAGLIADLVCSGEAVLVLCAHAEHRRGSLRDRLGGFALASWDSLESDPGLPAPYAHVVALDPPPHRHLHERLLDAPGDGYTHLAWGGQELDFTRQVLQWEHTFRAPLTTGFRALRAAGRVVAADCERMLRGEGPQPHSPVLAARLARLLCDLGLAEHEVPLALTATSPTASRPLEECPAYRAYGRRLDDGLRWLTRPQETVAAA
jgi:single-stranded-DNA-specific exonuclease